MNKIEKELLSMMAKRFSAVEFLGDKIFTTPVDSYEEALQMFYNKLYNDILLDEFIIVDELTDEVVFIGSEVYAQ